MNRDEIIRITREAGISKPWDQEPMRWETLERFAALVAAAEREECAKVCDDWQNSFEIDTRGWWASSLCAITIRAMGEKMTGDE